MTLIKDPTAPATPAQASYLADLVKNRDLPAVCEKYRLVTTIGTLQKGQASEWITALLAAPKKTGQPVTLINGTIVEPKPLAQAVEEIAATLTEIPAFGYYEIEGTFYYWDVTGKDAKPTLRRLAIIGTYDGKTKGSWKTVYGGQHAHANGALVTKAQTVTATYLPYGGKHWNYKTEVTKSVWVPGVLVAAALAGAKPLTQAQAAAKGKAVGFCIRCGATLTDPVSVANGIGPVCAKYWA